MTSVPCPRRPTAGARRRGAGGGRRAEGRGHGHDEVGRLEIPVDNAALVEKAGPLQGLAQDRFHHLRKR